MLGLSTANLLAGASAITPSSETTSYQASNVATPAKPMLPWRTAALGAQTLVIDFGSATALDVVALIRTNFASATVQGHASDAWTSPSYSKDITVARNLGNFRYQHVHRTALSAVPFNFRYLRLLIPSQTPLDGAAYYLLGGLWAGRWATVPRDINWPYSVTRIEPGVLVEPDHKGWEQWLSLGEPRVEITVGRRAVRPPGGVPGLGDELAAWLELERLTLEAGASLLQIEPGDPSQCWVVGRNASPSWSHDMQISESQTLTWRELMQV